MGKLAETVLATRAERNAAKRRLESQLDRLKGDMEERGIAGRIVDEASEAASDVFDDAMQVARESKGVIAGTTALLTIWFLRNPIIDWLEERLAKTKETEGMQDHDDQ